MEDGLQEDCIPFPDKNEAGRFFVLARVCYLLSITEREVREQLRI